MRMNSNISDSSIQCLSSNFPGTAIKELESYQANVADLPAVSSQRSEESASGIRELMMQRFMRLAEQQLPPHDFRDLTAEQVQTSFF